MDSFQSIIGDAAGNALCAVLGTYGASAPLLSAAALWKPGPITGTLAVTSGLAALAANYGCTWDPNQTGPGTPGAGYTGCQKFSSGWGNMFCNTPAWGDTPFPVATEFTEIIDFNGPYLIDEATNRWQVTLTIRKVSGEVVTGGSDFIGGAENFRVVPVEASNPVCENDAPGPSVPEPDPYIHTDPESGCQISVNFQGWALDGGGTAGGVWLMEPANPQSRASGGIIGGCNFAPTIYYDGGGSGGSGGGGGGGGGGPFSFPAPDPFPPSIDGEPWWAPILRGALQAGTLYAVEKALGELFEDGYPGGNYQLKGVCELDPDGNPMDVTRSTNFPPAKSFNAVLLRLDALAEMFQFAKDLKQPICTPTCTPPSGEPVTITFRSDLPSPVSGDPVRKIFTYFDQSGRSQLDHTQHWENFSWQAGAVVVSVNNTKLGKPQVWAATEAEGKRVINYAAQIAGVDMTDAEWIVTSPRSQRYGLSGTMRVYVDKASRIWVTKRDGPDGLPYVYKPT